MNLGFSYFHRATRTHLTLGTGLVCIKTIKLPANDSSMKWLKFVLVSVLLFILVSCYDINENIVVNANGSGTYVTKMDMGQFIDMMQTFAGDDELAKDGLDKPIDTTIHMKDIMDSAKDITPEQKELMKEGVMKIKMNMKEKVFNIDMSYPYKNFNALQMLMAGQ